MTIQDQVDRLIDERPGRQLLTPVYEDPAHRISDTIYRSSGTTAAYLLLTDRGRVIVNTGLGFEAPHHKRVFDAVRPGPTHHIITTQAHVDHVGGVGLFREPGTTYLAQANNLACQADDARIQALRMRTAGIWFDMLGTDAIRIAKENPGVSRCARTPPRRTSPSRTGSASPSTASAWSSSPPSGRPSTAASCGCPSSAPPSISNLLGPLFPHFPNLNTLRGDRYRSAEGYLATVRRLRELQPEVLVTGRHDPIVGAELIDASLERLHNAVDYVHRRALEGFNAGIDVWTLMREIELPAAPAGGPGLRQGGLGRAHAMGDLRRVVPAPVHHRDVPGLVGRRAAPSWWPPPASMPPSSGPRRPLARGDAVVAIRVAEAVETGSPEHPRARDVLVAAHRYLLDHGGDVSFWENGWLRHELDRRESG